MGLLKDMGPLLSFEESQDLQPLLKKLGIRQFLYNFKLYQNWKKKVTQNQIKWGYEIQGHFLQKNEKNQLQISKSGITQQYKHLNFPVMFEYGSWMFQLIPQNPHITLTKFDEVVLKIRQMYRSMKNKNKLILTIPSLPILGVHRSQQKDFNNQITQSLYIDDSHIASHIRFPTLTKNIRKRRGRTVEIKVPLYKDQNTNMNEQSQFQPYPGYIYMDAMAFGMGMSCLQCTFSTKNLDHARYIYDQLHIISPLFLALTAGTPFHRGKISNWDARWNIIEDSVDCRNQNQRNPSHQQYLPTSRYSPAQVYIWNGSYNRQQFNDLPLNINKQTLEYLKNSAKQMKIQIDQMLAIHIANIFKRDIMVVHQKFKEMTQQQDIIFDMLNGTNWNSVRLKPPNNDEIGWRVQFRTMEILLTPDENAAFSILIHLFVRALHQSTDINFYVPQSVVKENFERAHHNNALREQKFLFRTNIIGNAEPIIEQLSLKQIIFGKNQFKGLIFYIQQRLGCLLKFSYETKKNLNSIKQYLADLLSGKRITLAQWMRKFAYDHPLYEKDSILSNKLMDELLDRLVKIGTGQIKDENFADIFNF